MLGTVKDVDGTERCAGGDDVGVRWHVSGPIYFAVVRDFLRN